MPRPKSPRTIAHRTPYEFYKPAGVPLGKLEAIELGADEIETVRLCDQLGLYRQDAAKHMGVSRQTVDRILRGARKKIATALIEAKALQILLPEDDVPSQRKRKSKKKS